MVTLISVSQSPIHVQADEEQAALGEPRPQGLRDLEVALGKGFRDTGCRGGEIARVSPGLGMRRGSAARACRDKQDALVAVAISGM